MQDPARPSPGGAAGRPRARVHPRAGRAVQVEGGDQGRAGRGVRRRGAGRARGPGFDLAAYLVPAIALVLALGASATAVARWRRRRGPPATDAPSGPGTAHGAGTTRTPRGPTAEAAARLDRDLERYDFERDSPRSSPPRCENPACSRRRHDDHRLRRRLDLLRLAGVCPWFRATSPRSPGSRSPTSKADGGGSKCSSRRCSSACPSPSCSSPWA